MREAGEQQYLPGGQLVDVTAAVFGPDDNFVGGDELSSGPGLIIIAGHWAQQWVVACVKHLTHTNKEETVSYRRHSVRSM